jgi:hypothetical protein
MVVWCVVALNRYIVAPRAVGTFGPVAEGILVWLVTAILAFGGTFYYLLARAPNPPLAAARFGVYAVVLKGLFDFGLASAVGGQTGPTTQELLVAPEYWLEMVILIVAAYAAGQFFVRARQR